MLMYHAARQKESAHSRATPPMSVLLGLTNIAREYNYQDASALPKH